MTYFRKLLRAKANCSDRKYDSRSPKTQICMQKLLKNGTLLFLISFVCSKFWLLVNYIAADRQMSENRRYGGGANGGVPPPYDVAHRIYSNPAAGGNDTVYYNDQSGKSRWIRFSVLICSNFLQKV